MLRSRQHALPYKLHIVQHPEDRVYEARIQLTNQCLKNIQTDEFSLSRIRYSDERVFHVYGKVNKHNMRSWGTKNLIGEERKLGTQIGKVALERGGHVEHREH